MAIDLEQYRQTEAAECGLVSLAIVSALFGASVSVSELRRSHPVSPRGLTLKQVIDIASALHLSGRAVRCEIEELAKLSLPSILHWGLNHFVVLESFKRGKAIIVDTASGKRAVDERELSAKFTGVRFPSQLAQGSYVPEAHAYPSWPRPPADLRSISALAIPVLG